MSGVYAVLICDPSGLRKTEKVVSESGLKVTFESQTYEGGWKLWVFERSWENDFLALESKLPKKSARGYILKDGYETSGFAGHDGALSENIFKLDFLRTHGLKMKEFCEKFVLAEIEENAAYFLEDASRSVNDGIVTYRVDTLGPVRGLRVDEGKVGVFAENVVLKESEYYNVFFNAQGKLICSGVLDPSVGDFCGPNVIINFQPPSGEEGVVDPEGSGLRWLWINFLNTEHANDLWRLFTPQV